MSNSSVVELIVNKIFEIRGKKVMLDRDLAKLYGVSAKVLNQAVKRNTNRFPEDFMFQLSWKEVKSLRSQIVTLNTTKPEVSGRGKHVKYLPYVFTEQGVAMLSSVLNSNRAIRVNIQIMRAFVELRKMLITNADLKRKIESLEKEYDKQFSIVFEAIRQLLEPPKRTDAIGFHV